MSQWAIRGSAVRLAVVVGIVLAGSLASPSSALPKPGKPHPGTFTVDARLTDATTWELSMPHVTMRQQGVHASGIQPQVVAWTPGSGLLTVRLGVRLDKGALAGSRMVVDWISPAYETNLAPDGIAVLNDCHPTRLPGPHPGHGIHPFGAREGWGPRYGECVDVGDVGAGQSVTADFALRIGAPSVTSFRLVYHLEDAAQQHRIGLAEEGPAPAAGKVLAPPDGQLLTGMYAHAWHEDLDRQRKMSRWSAKVGRPPAIVYTIEPKFPLATPAGLVSQMKDAASRGAVLARLVGLGEFDQDNTGAQFAQCQRLTYQLVIDQGCGGQLDALWTDYAVAIRDSGLPVMLTTIEEGGGPLLDSSFGPNGDESWQGKSRADQTRFFGDPDLPDGPERFVAYHRHLVDLFRQVGATNVTWFAEFRPLDGPGRDCGTDRWWLCPEHLYPGDDYVDWLGVNLVNYGGGIFSDGENPITGKYDGPMGYDGWHALAPHKPIFAPNTYPSVLWHRMRSDNSQLYRDLFGFLRTRYPAVKAMTFWDDQSVSPVVWSALFGSPEIGFFQVDEAQTFVDELADRDRYPLQVTTGS